MSEVFVECWNCHTQVTLAEISDEDGFCPHCMCELDLEDYLEQSVATIDQLRTTNQRLEGEVARLKADSARYQFLKENCQQDVDGYRNETPVLVHALSHIPEWRNRIDDSIDAALSTASGEVTE